MLYRILLDLIFPSRCLNCFDYGPVICAACLRDLELRTWTFCAECRARLPENKKVCHFDSPCILGGAVNYSSPAAKALVRGLKFQGIKEAAEPLGKLLANYILATGLKFKDTVIVPVPLGKRRERLRGYNQSFLISLVVGKMLGIPLSPELLSRSRETKPQSDLKSGAERGSNVEDCFVSLKEARGKNIILVDDVLTSGATMRSAAKALRKSEARRIIALASTMA